jgi:hypothetical protein
MSLQLVKTRKPTGDAVCPPHVRRAHEIDYKLQSKVACRDLEDEDLIEIDNHEGDASDDEMSDSYDPPEDTERHWGQTPLYLVDKLRVN